MPMSPSCGASLGTGLQKLVKAVKDYFEETNLPIAPAIHDRKTQCWTGSVPQE